MEQTGLVRNYSTPPVIASKKASSYMALCCVETGNVVSRQKSACIGQRSSMTCNAPTSVPLLTTTVIPSLGAQRLLLFHRSTAQPRYPSPDHQGRQTELRCSYTRGPKPHLAKCIDSCPSAGRQTEQCCSFTHARGRANPTSGLPPCPAWENIENHTVVLG